MSVRIMSKVWDMEMEGTTPKLVLLSLADQANDEGVCWPRVETIAKRCCLSIRQTKRVIAYLRENGYINVYDRHTNPNPNQRSNVYQITLSSDKKAERNDTDDTTPSATDDTTSNATDDTTLINRKIKPSISKALSPKARPHDARASHPAIAAIREVMQRFPNKAVWDQIIAEVGMLPQVERMKECYIAWVARGYNPMGMGWLFDWYKNGVIPKNGKEAKAVRPLQVEEHPELDFWGNPLPEEFFEIGGKK